MYVRKTGVHCALWLLLESIFGITNYFAFEVVTSQIWVFVMQWLSLRWTYTLIAMRCYLCEWVTPSAVSPVDAPVTITRSKWSELIFFFFRSTPTTNVLHVVSSPLDATETNCVPIKHFRMHNQICREADRKAKRQKQSSSARDNIIFISLYFRLCLQFKNASVKKDSFSPPPSLARTLSPSSTHFFVRSVNPFRMSTENYLLPTY